MNLKKIVEYLTPIKEKRSVYENNPHKIFEIIQEGSRKAREIAQKTLDEVNESMNLKINRRFYDKT